MFAEKAIMAADSQEDLPIKPQQIIGGINGLILQLHKTQVELEECKHRQDDYVGKIRTLETKNEGLKNEIDNLTRLKERLNEQSGFLQKSLKQKTTENNDLSERLKQAEIKLGESGSVLETVRSLESKNEILSVKMSSVVLNTEEEISKAKTQRDHYLKLLDEINDLNMRNVAIQKGLEEAEKANRQYREQARALVEKTEGTCSEISKNLDEILHAREKYLNLNEEKENLEKKAKNNLEAKASIQRECKCLEKKIKDLEMSKGDLERSLQEQRRTSEFLNEQLAKSQQEKETLYKEVYSLWKQQDKTGRLRSPTDGLVSSQNVPGTKRYDTFEKQMKLLAESYGETPQQLRFFKDFADEITDFLKPNTEGAAKIGERSSPDLRGMAESLEGSSESRVSREYVEILLKMQEIYQHSDERDEELDNLEKIAGIPVQRVEGGKTETSSAAGDCSGIASCIRGLVAMKDSQIDTLAKERDELWRGIVEKKKMEYRQQYIVNELQKEKDELVKKLTACREKYRKVKEEKEDLRQDVLVRNATDNMTQTHMNNLKLENEKYKNELEKQQQSMKQKFVAIKSDFDKKLEAKDTTIQTMKEKLVDYQNERDSMKSELDALQLKDNVIKEQIISIFEEKNKVSPLRAK